MRTTMVYKRSSMRQAPPMSTTAAARSGFMMTPTAPGPTHLARTMRITLRRAAV